uniref:Lysosomal Pro-X carboxypeptidase n=1 Tax=Laticauda laticaudata TaxID=8630 RepID=A0A8C5S9I2_LATLA
WTGLLCPAGLYPSPVSSTANGATLPLPVSCSSSSSDSDSNGGMTALLVRWQPRNVINNKEILRDLIKLSTPVSFLIYKACTEMVMPMCSDGINDMFEPQKWDFHAYSEECFKAWGVRPRPSWIPTFYGGKNISAHSNIIFSNGGLDPWSGGGVTKNITDTLVAIMIPEGAHHLDLRSNNPFDPISVLQARLLEQRLSIGDHLLPGLSLLRLAC